MIYEGECVGGPEDGKHYTCRVPFLRIPVLQKFDPWAVPTDALQQPACCEIVTYRHDPKHGKWRLETVP